MDFLSQAINSVIAFGSFGRIYPTVWQSSTATQSPMVEKGGVFVLILYLKALQTEADTISDPWVVGPARG